MTAPTYTVTFEEVERQLVLLAMARLARDRGWAGPLRDLARQLRGLELFDEFLTLAREEARGEVPPIALGPDLAAVLASIELEDWSADQVSAVTAWVEARERAAFMRGRVTAGSGHV